MKIEQFKTFVMVAPHGLEYVGLHRNENDCWQVALGWPSDDEIDWHKANGFYVCKAQITWQKPTALK